MIRPLLTAAVLFVAASTALAQDAAPARPSAPAFDKPVDVKALPLDSRHAVARRLPRGQAPVIDGRLDDAVWQLAPVHGDFVQRDPKFGYPASERTEFRVLYDDDTIYVGVWVFEKDPANIRASELRRDASLNKGDQIKIVFDTFHDHRNAFYFSTNPLGAYRDANSVENGRTVNYDWNSVYENRTSIDDKGWYVELAVPFNQLRFKASAEELVWGLNVCRMLATRNEDSYWSPYPREWGVTGLWRVSAAGVLDGLRGLKAKRRFEAVPFILPSVSRDYVAHDVADSSARFGGDLKLGLTNDLTADFTFHTDFAQVEADQEVVNLTRFSLFFPEKRQFFTESAGIFDYGKAVTGLGGDSATNDPGLMALFYSRRIGLVDGQQIPLVGGGRITGRVGDYTLGLINITTEPGELHRGAETTVLDRANYTAFRLKRNILAKSSIGALFLNSENGISPYNRAVGFDTSLVLGQSVTLMALGAKTFSPGVSGGDTAALVDFAFKNDRFSYGAQFQDIGERFNAEMGYIPRLDIRAGKAKAGWTPRPKWRGVRQVLVNYTGDYYQDHSGRLDSKSHVLEAQVQQQNSAVAKVNVSHLYDSLESPFSTAGTAIPVGAYAWDTMTASYSTNRAHAVIATLSGDVGGYYNGTRQAATANLVIQAGGTLIFEPIYTRNRVSLPGLPTYTSNVLNLRVSHSFSPNFFLKGFFQYNDDRKTSSFNFLWWYRYRPGSDLYVVYNQGWDVGLPLTSVDAASHRVHNRSFAVKFTYWITR